MPRAKEVSDVLFAKTRERMGLTNTDNTANPPLQGNETREDVPNDQ